MPKFLIEYKHVEESTYEQWVEATSEKKALEKIKEEADFANLVSVQGIEVKDYKILEEN